MDGSERHVLECDGKMLGPGVRAMVADVGPWRGRAEGEEVRGGFGHEEGGGADC